MTCGDCKHFKEYKNQFNDPILGLRWFDGVCRQDQHTERKSLNMCCGKHKSKGRVGTKNKQFVKPTLSQVREYVSSRKSDVDAEKWMDHYESKGWQIGKGAMKDWKAAVRTWEKTKEPGSKDCVDCEATYEEGFKFTGPAKNKKYRCPACQKTHKENRAT